MLRHSLFLAALLTATIVSADGCRSCSSCHDYDPPVANCEGGSCGQPCGCGDGCSSCGCADGSCNGGESSGQAYATEGEAVESAPAYGQVISRKNGQPYMPQPPNAR